MSGKATKVVFLGDSGVGKTCVIDRIVHPESTGIAKASNTIGSKSYSFSQIVSGEKYEFNLWDTAGSATYQTMAATFSADAVCCVLVFSLDDHESFQNIDGWIGLVSNIKTIKKFIIVGNKNDMPNKVVELSEIEEYQKTKNMDYVVTSAETKEGIEELKECIISSVVAVPLKSETTEDASGKCCRI